MPADKLLVKHKPGVGPDLPLPDGESLTFYTGEMITVNVDNVTRYEKDDLPVPLPKTALPGAPGAENPKAVMDVSDPENPVFSHWLLTTRDPEEVLRPFGGYVVLTPEPVGGLVVIEVRSTQAKLDTLHGVLVAEDNAYGRCDEEKLATLENTFALKSGALREPTRIG